MNIETIKKALGKKRLAKIEHVNFWGTPIGSEAVELVMKAPYVDQGETVIDEERENDECKTQKEWIDYIKFRVDMMEFDPEGWNECGGTVPYDTSSEGSSAHA